MWRRVANWRRQARHRSRCRYASGPLFVRLERRFDGVAEERGSPGFPEIYWARHILGQLPSAGVDTFSADDAELRQAIADLAGWLAVTAENRGAGVAPDDIAAVLDALGASADEPQVPATIRDLCDLAVEELSVD